MDPHEYNRAYYARHGDNLRAEAKKRYAANSDKYRAAASANYLKNKTAIQARMARIIPCPHCQKPITASNKSKHMRTKMCKLYGALSGPAASDIDPEMPLPASS